MSAYSGQTELKTVGVNRCLIRERCKQKHLIGFCSLVKNERLPLQAAFRPNHWLLMDRICV